MIPIWGRSEGGGGPAPPYTASAVHFDDSSITYLYRRLPFDGAVDGSKFLTSFWVNNDTFPPSQPNHEDIVIFSTFPQALLNYFCQNSMGLGERSTFSQAFFFSFSPFTAILNPTDQEIFPISNSWTNFICSADLGHSDPDKILQIAIGGIVVGSSINESGDVTGPKIVPLSTEQTTYFGTDGQGSGCAMDTADFQFWQGVSADLSNPEVIANFISGGKPVDPAIAAVTFGDHTVLFSGDATGFLVNQGGGGAWALSGSISSTIIDSGGNSWAVGDAFSIAGGNADATGSVAVISPAPVSVAINGVIVGSFSSVITVDQSAKTFTVNADFTDALVAGVVFQIVASLGNNGNYTTVSTIFGGGNTVVTVLEDIPDATVDGSLVTTGAFSVAGNHTGSIIAPNKVIISGSTGNDGAYIPEVVAFSGGNTIVYPSIAISVADPTVDGTFSTTGAISSASITDPGSGYIIKTGVLISKLTGIGLSATVDITDILTGSLTNASSSPSD